MEPYTILFGLGLVGLVLMAALGVLGGHHEAHGHVPGHTHGIDAHAGHGALPANHGHTGALNGHGHDLSHHTPAAHHGNAPATGAGQAGTHSHGGPAHGQAVKGGARHAHGGKPNWRNALLSWLSPRVLFTLSLGAGATGLLVLPWVPMEPWRGGLSLVGALGLEKLVVAPVWGVFERFASRPARTLDTAVFEEAVAIANFDSEGNGVVSIDLDGHEMRILARLSEPNSQDRVRSGETLLIESVDSARNRCVVRRLNTPA